MEKIKKIKTFLFSKILLIIFNHCLLFRENVTEDSKIIKNSEDSENFTDSENADYYDP